MAKSRVYQMAAMWVPMFGAAWAGTGESVCGEVAVPNGIEALLKIGR
jgi:hypothetical protein